MRTSGRGAFRRRPDRVWGRRSAVRTLEAVPDQRFAERRRSDRLHQGAADSTAEEVRSVAAVLVEEEVPSAVGEAEGPREAGAADRLFVR